ncbi:hypothetical protein [Streptomyces thermodiastaticus]|uniref:hypothetical protein n=1 Tax=Streptomyces thermodiastaticus TaxID=44061 RepID=UPI00167BF714|nr:hypothetical protein [Streptomyces thermodiastaticus]MCE7552770.1 hypothetical protein [Streptomyces thermodiastaticus]GHF89036.1 hypothetical protein GCM10018787_42150 [Streptomyces thermodiastaticus]
MATTKTNTIADVIKQAEAEHAKKVKGYASDLLSTREAVERFATEAAQAEEKLNGHRATLGRGDDSVSPEAFAAAFHNVERTSLLRDGSKRKLATLERTPAHADKHVAERIAEAVRAIVPSDVEVIPTFANVRTFETDHAAVVVVQDSPTVFTGGRESAGVTVRVFRNKRYSRMLDRPKLANAITARGWHIPGSHVPGDKMTETPGVGVDEIKVQGVSVFDAIPTLKNDPTEHALRQAAGSLAYEAGARVDVGGPVNLMPISGGGVRTGQFQIRVKGVKHDSRTVKGERTTEVIAEVAFQTNALSLPTGEVRKAIVDAAQTLPGRFLDGAGVVTDGVQIKHLSDPSPASGVEHTMAVRFSLKSKTGA